MTWKISNTTIDPDPYYGAVSLLLHGDGTNGSTNIIDSSLNTKTITVFGNAQISTTLSKFNGSSLAFDGSEDYLNAGVSGDYNFGTGDFTIEAWIYPLSFGITRAIVDGRSNVSAPHYLFALNTSGKLFFVAGFTTIGVSTIELDTWTHVAVSRNSGLVRLFVNGLVEISATNTNLIAQSAFLAIGGGRSSGSASVSGNYFNGYIDDLRITRGVARYTSNFTPPSRPFYDFIRPGTSDPYFSNVSLLLHGDGTNGSKTFLDSSINKFNITPYGNAQISTAQSKFGGASMYFDGTGDYLGLPSSSKFATGTSDFTLECWYYPVSKATQYPRIFQVGTSFWITSDNWALLDRHDSAPTKFSWACYNLGGNSLLLTSTTTVTNNVWYHIALTRSGSTFRLFINGTLESTYTNSGAVTTNASTGAWVASAAGTGDSTAHAYIDDLRFTKGVARYTDNFTPPTRAFPDF